MARYVTLLRFTDQGARNIKKSPTRALAFRKAVEKAGVKVDVQLWTLGKENGVLILSGDDRKVLRALTQLAALGNVRTRTMQAFDAREFKAIVGQLKEVPSSERVAACGADELASKAGVEDQADMMVLDVAFR